MGAMLLAATKALRSFNCVHTRQLEYLPHHPSRPRHPSRPLVSQSPGLSHSS